MVRRCALTGVALTPEVDSDAHIIPSALCGHLRPRGLLSRRANAILNEKVDLPLVAALAPLVSMLGAKRDRGDLLPLDLTDTDGVLWRYAFGEPLRPRNPSVTTRIEADGAIRIDARAGNRKHLRQVLGKVAKDHPGLDVEVMMAGVEDVYAPGHAMLRQTFSVDEYRTFPACWTMLVLFAYHTSGWLHPYWREYIEALDVTRPGLPPVTYFLISDDWFHHAAAPPVCHRLIVRGSARLGVLFGYVELFGVLCVASVLSDSWESDCEHVYAWDVVGAQRLEGLKVHDEKWIALPSSNPTSAALGDFLIARLQRLFGVALERQHDANTERRAGEAVREGLRGLSEGDRITPEAMNRIVDEFMMRLVMPRFNKN